MKQLIATAKSYGSRIALHENYVDMYPDSTLYDETALARSSLGVIKQAWYNSHTKVRAQQSMSYHLFIRFLFFFFLLTIIYLRLFSFQRAFIEARQTPTGAYCYQLCPQCWIRRRGHFQLPYSLHQHVQLFLCSHFRLSFCFEEATLESYVHWYILVCSILLFHRIQEKLQWPSIWRGKREV